LLALLASLVAACSAAPVGGRLDRLQPCKTGEGPPDARCGRMTVFEDRASKAGRQIDLWVVVLPSLAATPEPDPLVFLAGGPGQSAAHLAPQIDAVFGRVQRRRDIVLVDQRGTGRSNPLNCTSDVTSLRELTEDTAAALSRLRVCLEGYDADVRLYTTDIAMDDLDEVRAYLGYERINLYGGSYGTRAALVYLRQHGSHVRSMVLDGVAPTDMRLPLFTSRDAQRSLDRLLADCDADPGCTRTFPGLSSRIRALLVRLAARPAEARIVHPRTGVAEDVRVDARLVATVLFSALYSPLTGSIVPSLVDAAERQDFQSLFALAMAGDETTSNMSLGMQLSVLCSEDASQVTPEDVAGQTSASVFGSHLIGSQLEACAMWPTRSMPAEYYEPVVSDVPTLILSGEEDPVTPPVWGDAVARHLARSLHLTVPGTGHGVASTPCGNSIVTSFIERGTTEGLDTTCVKGVRRPPFFVSPAGPDPDGRGGSPR
jgi:pimeloyl-ACP methyl ester carboxylesterase